MSLAHAVIPQTALLGMPSEVFLYHLPSHGIGDTLCASNAERADASFIYVCLHLNDEELTPAARAKLEALGAECVMEGAPFHAYCIVRNDEAVFEALLEQPEVFDLAQEEPPCAK